MERRQGGIAALGIVALGLLWLLLIAPLRQDVERLHRALPEYRQEMEEMRQLRRSYAQLQADEDALEQRVRARGGSFTLFAFVTEVAQRQGLALASLSPTSRAISEQWQVERVEIALENVSMSALIAFLHTLTDPAQVVRIDRFQLRQGSRGISVTLEAQTVSLRS